jgi:hypothetical protein
MLMIGGQTKTDTHVVTYWWPSEGDNRDFRNGSDVGVWLGKQRALNKKSEADVCKAVMEQFPFLTQCESRDTWGKMARVTR